MSPRLRIAAIVVTVAVAFGILPSHHAYAAATPPTVQRVADSDRYSTAVAISRHAFPNARGGVVYIASGTNYPDALAAAPAAYRDTAPVLLTKPAGLPDVVKRELARLAPSRIVIVGGVGAVSGDVATQLRAYGVVTRLSGDDRFLTAQALSKTFARAKTVYIASGVNFPDALSASAIAAREAAPILLTATGAASPAVLDEIRRLQPARIVIVGGPGAVEPAVEEQLQSRFPQARIDRRAGDDRYETNRQIAAGIAASRPSVAYVASGADFPDALAAAPAAAALGAPVLLTRPAAMPDTVHALLRDAGPANVIVVGGPGAVSDTVMRQLQGLPPGAAVGGSWQRPLTGAYSVGRGFGYNPVAGCSFCSTDHRGFDMVQKCGSAVSAAGPGRVITAGAYQGYGNTVRIQHAGGYVTLYGHMAWDSLRVRVGDDVVAGVRLGDEGTTGNSNGCHLHFQVSKDGVAIDPEPFMSSLGVPLR